MTRGSPSPCSRAPTCPNFRCSHCGTCHATHAARRGSGGCTGAAGISPSRSPSSSPFCPTWCAVAPTWCTSPTSTSGTSAGTGGGSAGSSIACFSTTVVSRQSRSRAPTSCSSSRRRDSTRPWRAAKTHRVRAYCRTGYACRRNCRGAAPMRIALRSAFRRTVLSSSRSDCSTSKRSGWTISSVRSRHCPHHAPFFACSAPRARTRPGSAPSPRRRWAPSTCW